MRRRLVLALAVASGSLAVATEAQAVCTRDPGVPRHDAQVTTTRNVTKVVLCDHARGRERVVRRARFRLDARRGSGVIGDASAAGGRVAWIEERNRGGLVPTVSVTVKDIRTRRRVRRIRLGPGEDKAPPVELGIALTSRNQLVWLYREKVVLKAPGQRRRVLARGASRPLTLEDDGTLVWRRSFSEAASFELAPPPQSGGCPKRAGYAPVADADGVLVTERRLVKPAPDVRREQVVRACVRGSGRDAIAAYAFSDGFDSLTIEGVTAGAGRVAYVTSFADRYGGCEQQVQVLEAATLRPGRRSLNACDPPAAARGAPFVLTTGGAPAWLAPAAPGAVRVLGIDGLERYTELDRGAITNLRADGDEVVWDRDGREWRTRL